MERPRQQREGASISRQGQVPTTRLALFFSPSVCGEFVYGTTQIDSPNIPGILVFLGARHPRHRLVNHMTTALAPGDLLRFLASVDHEPGLMDFSEP